MWHIDFKQNKSSFKHHYKLYLMEALGLAIFMVSACFFAGQLWHAGAYLNGIIQNEMARNWVMGIAMGATALFIFYSPVTAPSGSHINPAVTLAQYYLGRINGYDTFYYIVFQFLGGTLAVYLMAFLMGDVLTTAPVNFVATVPGKDVSNTVAALYETVTAFIMTMMVLNVGASKLKRFTRLFAAILVCNYVYFAGPVSGFGMNPARTFASALPSGNFTAFWIYVFFPIFGMVSAAFIYKNKIFR